MIQKKALHHEGHEDHEEFFMGCMMPGNRLKGGSDFGTPPPLFFAVFVRFVVQIRNFG